MQGTETLPKRPDEHYLRQEINTPASIEVGIREAKQFFASKDLPILARALDIQNAVKTHDVVLLDAETGSGKSTAGPILFLEEQLKTNPNARIIATQPRRLAAANIAKYLREKSGMGEYVGYRYRGTRETNDQARIEYVMEQGLLNRLVDDELLEGVSGVFLDEIHEGSKAGAVAMAILNRTQEKRKAAGLPPLTIMLASATMPLEDLQEYYGENAEHLKIPGRSYPVEIEYSPVPIDPQDRPTRLAEKAFEIVSSIKSGKPEDILGFLPGKGEIEEAQGVLNSLLPPGHNVEIITLMGGDQSDESIQSISEESDHPRIFLASDAAKTSITIDPITTVIDSGLLRTDKFDPNTKLSELITIQVPQSDADQRSGRAGRTRPGKAYRLYTKEEYEASDKHMPAEMRRSDITKQVLLLKSKGIDYETLKFLHPPDDEKIPQALEALKNLGALNPDGTVTEIGKEMSELESDPRFARMLVEAKRLGCLDAVSILVALLQNPSKSVFAWNRKDGQPFMEKYQEYITPGNDLVTLLNVWNDYISQPFNKRNDEGAAKQRKQWADQKGIRTRTLYNAAKARKDMLSREKFVDKPVALTPESIAKITQSIIVGLPENIIVRKGTEYQSLGGATGIRISDSSVLFRASPEGFVSGNIHKTEKGGSYAGFNIALTAEQARALAPLLDAKNNTNNTEETKVAAEEPPTPQEFPESSDSQNNHENDTGNHEDIETAVSKDSLRPLADIYDPEIPPIPHYSDHVHEVLSEEPKNIFQKIGEKVRQFGIQVGNAIRSFLRKLKIIR